jgi:polysaccharide export outer membrane protein
MFRAFILSLIHLIAVGAVWAQQQPVTRSLPNSAPTVTPLASEDASVRSKRAELSGDDRYRIGPGDVLEVRVARVPEFSREAVRVDQRGMIRMPMLDVDIPAACLTEPEVAQNVARLYLKYKKDPKVDVFVKEYQSQMVAVIGAVRGPAQFKLQHPLRLSELLTFAGGPTDNAGGAVEVIHAGGASFCERRAGLQPDDLTSGFVVYKLDDTLHALPAANPFVRPGDLIQIPNADQAYVLGNVLRPIAIPLKEPLTVSRAIAIAGGVAPATKKDKVRIIRQVPGSSSKQEIAIDLGAILKNQAEDVVLLKNDIVDVPSSGVKTVLRSLVGAIGPAVTQLPIHAIP